MKRFYKFAVLPILAVFAVGLGIGAAIRAADHLAVASAAKEPYSYRDIVKHALPAVVSIESIAHPAKTMKQASAKTERGPGPNIPEEFRRFFDNVPMPEGKGFEHVPHDGRLGSGSGFIIDPTGVIVTNFHVVNGADQVEVTLKDGRKFLSKNIKVDPKTDLAIIHLDTKESLPTLEWGDSSAMEIGDRVLAVGAPFGLKGTVTNGIVSSKGRSLQLNMYEDFIQTDAAINPGNSGGPLINLEGKVIGINSVIKSQTGGFQGVGLAISSNLARQVIDQLLTNGTVTRGYLGVQMRSLAPEVASRLGLKENQGILVAKVMKDGPAAKAGIEDGDVVTAFDGKPIGMPADLSFAVAKLTSGKHVALTVLRDGKSRTVDITIGQQPAQFGAAEPRANDAAPQPESSQLEKLGFSVADLTKNSAEHFGFSQSTDGAVVTEVDDNGLAANAGLRAGQMIVKVDGKQVSSAKAVKEAVSAGSVQKGILMQVRSANEGVSFALVQEMKE